MSGPLSGRAPIPPASMRDLALRKADAAMQAAKAQFSTAALSCLRGDLDAPVRVRAALEAVDKARAEVARLADAAIDASKPATTL